MTISLLIMATSRGVWSRREQALLGKIAAEFSKGFDVHCLDGTTDEGDAWASCHDDRTGAELYHLARDGRAYVLVWPDGSSERALTLNSLLNIVRRHTRTTADGDSAAAHHV